MAAAAAACDPRDSVGPAADRLVFTSADLGDETTVCAPEPGGPENVAILADLPSLEVAGTDTDPLYRVTDALLVDGDLFVLSGGTEILRFSERGELVQRAGGEGEGPGEFLLATDIAPYLADSLVIFDSELQRVSVFSRDLAFGRAVRLEIPLPNVRFVGALPSGAFVARGTDSYFGQPATRDTGYALVYDEGGAVTDSLLRLPHTISFTAPFGAEFRPGTAPYSSQAWHATHDSLVIMGAGDRATLWLRGGSDAGYRTVEFACAPGPVRDARVDAYRRERLEGTSAAQRGSMREFLDRMPFPDSLPIYRRILTGPPGRIWLGVPAGLGAESTHWIVLDLAGHVLGAVTVPDGLYVFQMGEDFVLGLFRDELRGERVSVFHFEPR